MDKTIKLFLGLAIVAIASSCSTKLEPVPQFEASATALTATASATSVAVAAKDSLAQALTFTWNDPKYSVGLAQSKFTVMVGAKDKNFASFQSKGFTGVLTGALLGKEVNAFALKLGGAIGTPINLDVKVVSSQANNNETKSSAVTTIAVTPYGDLGLSTDITAIEPLPTKANDIGITFTWGVAFNGFVGVKTYQLQHASAGSSFASPTSIAVSGYSKGLTHLELNNIALGYNIAPSVEGNVEFRLKATNELDATVYSNTVTIKVKPYVAINSIGLIGDSTPGGWDIDTDLYRPDPNGKPSEWTVKIYLVGGKNALFRQDDKWVNKWGVGGKGGADIPVSNTGYYTVNLNVATGVYSFTPFTVPSIPNGLSLTGDGIGGWGVDTKLTQDPVNSTVFTGTVTLTVGSVKFRHTGDWNINWGGPAGDNDPLNYPSAWGKNNGGNLKINTAGTYFVWIDIATGEYFFGNTANSTPYNKLGIIGDATSGGWSAETFLIKNPTNPYKWSGKVDLTAKEAKFRANTDWGLSWGNASAFPSGIANTENNNNIKIASAGTYQIIYNSATREFSFAK